METGREEIVPCSPRHCSAATPRTQRLERFAGTGGLADGVFSLTATGVSPAGRQQDEAASRRGALVSWQVPQFVPAWHTAETTDVSVSFFAAARTKAGSSTSWVFAQATFSTFVKQQHFFQH